MSFCLHKTPTFKLQCKSSQAPRGQIYIIGVRGLTLKQRGLKIDGTDRADYSIHLSIFFKPFYNGDIKLLCIYPLCLAILVGLNQVKERKCIHKVLHVLDFAFLFRTYIVKRVPIAAKISCHSAFLFDPFAHKACHICCTKQPVYSPEN